MTTTSFGALPPQGLVVLIGPAGSGKSTYAARSYPEYAVFCLDAYRLAATDSAADQSATPVAAQIQDVLLDARLARLRTTIVDSTAVLPHVRRAHLARARHWQAPAVAVFFDIDLELCLGRNAERPRIVPERVIREHYAARPTAAHLRAEGWDTVLTVGTSQTAGVR
jgi:predicted kinase